jgi:hypothetical protein
MCQGGFLLHPQQHLRTHRNASKRAMIIFPPILPASYGNVWYCD